MSFAFYKLNVSKILRIKNVNDMIVLYFSWICELCDRMSIISDVIITSLDSILERCDPNRKILLF